ncbi:unnamed protein product [Chrysoparadoxa australica]
MGVLKIVMGCLALLRAVEGLVIGHNIPYVILPGFGNCAQDYVDPFNKGEEGLVGSLEQRGVPSFVLPLKRSDWFKVLRGLGSKDFWEGKAPPTGPAYKWYLDLVKKTVDQARETCGSDRVVLCGHSAGGWLGRAVMGDGTWSEGKATSDVVAGLVTLGAPHFPPPVETTNDMTRGALTFTSKMYPNCYLSEKGIFYVTVAGTAVEGSEEAPRGDRWRFAFESYKTVAGDGNQIGDGYVPEGSAHLDGAVQISLKDVYHSVDTPEMWYGSEKVVDRWLEVSRSG